MTRDRHILIVDDDLETLVMLEQLLQHYFSCRTGTASSVEAAKLYLQNHRVDLIISDYNMPGENGLAFARDLRHRGLKKPFVFYTASDLRQADLQHDEGVYPCFQKPDFKGLLTAVGQLMKENGPCL